MLWNFTPRLLLTVWMRFSLSRFQKVTEEQEPGKIANLGTESSFRSWQWENKGINQQAARRLAAPHPSPAPAQTAPGTPGEEPSLCSAVSWLSPEAAAVWTSLRPSLGHILMILWDGAQGESARWEVGPPPPHQPEMVHGLDNRKCALYSALTAS